jgi:hypothetical protein
MDDRDATTVEMTDEGPLYPQSSQLLSASCRLGLSARSASSLRPMPLLYRLPLLQGGNMPKPVQIQGKDYYVNHSISRGETATGDVNMVIELYDEEPSWHNGVVSKKPVQSIHLFGDAGSLYYQFKEAIKVLDATRSW